MSSGITSYSRSVTRRSRRIGAKTVKKVKPLSEYQKFMQEELKKQKQQQPGLSNNEYMKRAAIAWNNKTVTGWNNKKTTDNKSEEKKPKINIKKNVPQHNKETGDICASIRSNEEPHYRCLLYTKPGYKYCPLHLAQKNITDYTFVDQDIIDKDMQIMNEPAKIIINPVLKKISLTNPSIKKPIDKKIGIKEDTTLHEQKVSTIESSHQETEDDLEIKLLILVNDDQNTNIADLIGPVFKDITKSEDQEDPVTLDAFWTLNNNTKVPSSINKYYLFSYIDSKQKIRCLTVFTIYNMINNNHFIHPITMEEIPEKDIKRAKKLINLYSTKLGLFRNLDESLLSPEFKLKNRITKLFKKFHEHSIFFEESWLMDINNKTNLYKIITETEKFVSNNIKSINPGLTGFKVFQKKANKKQSRKGKEKYSDDDEDDDSLISLKEYIVTEWERLIQAADSNQNQIPIWIIASGLSFVVPEIKQKYPNLEIML